MTAQAPSGSVTSELRLPAAACELGAARRFASERAQELGLDAQETYDFAYAVNEAVTNAIRHGAPAPDGCIGVTIVLCEETISCMVHDHGSFSAPIPLPPPGLESGRGFALMAELVDDVELQVEARGTTVTLRKARV